MYICPLGELLMKKLMMTLPGVCYLAASNNEGMRFVVCSSDGAACVLWILQGAESRPTPHLGGHDPGRRCDHPCLRLPLHRRGEPPNTGSRD